MRLDSLRPDAIAERLGDGFGFGVTYPPEELAEVREFIKSIKVNYPVTMGEEQTKALFNQGGTLPVTVMIDKKGMVREVIQGIIFPEEFDMTFNGISIYHS